MQRLRFPCAAVYAEPADPTVRCTLLTPPWNGQQPHQASHLRKSGGFLRSYAGLLSCSLGAWSLGVAPLSGGSLVAVPMQQTCCQCAVVSAPYRAQRAAPVTGCCSKACCRVRRSWPHHQSSHAWPSAAGRRLPVPAGLRLAELLYAALPQRPARQPGN